MAAYVTIYDSRRYVRSDSTDTTFLLPVIAGGSGANLSSTGGANQFVKQSTVGGVFTVAILGAGDVPDAALTTNVALLNRSQQNFTQGNRFTGSLGAGTGILRSDAQIETYGTTGMISIVQTTNPGTTANESAYVWGAYDGAGTLIKTASISSKHVVATATTGYAVLRFNSTYAGGGSDDVALRIFGNKGVTFWGAGDAAANAPGAQILNINGTGYTKITQTGSNITGNFYDVLDVRDGTSTYGFLLGYDSTSGAGVISGLANAPIAFWTFNGSAWGERARVSDKGSFVTGGTAALATNATDGFLYIPSCAGAPTGTPTAFTGRLAIVYDSTNNQIYVYNAAWKKTVALT